MKKTLLVALTVILLLVGAITGQAQSGSIRIGQEYSFESLNFPGEYIRHQNSLGEKSKIVSELDRKDASFRVVKGLAGTCVSFESVNYPGHYLRHQNSRIKLHQPDGSELFNKDATFCSRPGLANASAWSFESLNYPGFFLTHNNGHLFIERRQDALFAQDATFNPRPALYQSGSASSDDFYIIFASDTQYPWVDIPKESDKETAISEQFNRNFVKSWQSIASSVGNSQLKGIIINGDLTAFGHSWQLDKFKQIYQGTGLKIYPGLGNHDYANNVDDCYQNSCANGMVLYMYETVKNLGVSSYDFKEGQTYYQGASLQKDYRGSLAYSWDIGNVHFVQLHNYPAYARSWGGWNTGSARRDNFYITSAFSWLRNDLVTARNRGKKIILNMHDCGEHFIGEHRGEWDEFFKMVTDYQVSAIFAGHIHKESRQIFSDGGYTFPVPVFRSGGSSYNTYLLAHFKGSEVTVEAVSSEDGGAARRKIRTVPLTGGQAINANNQPIIIPAPPKDGTITFFNQGGYSAKFYLSYSANGKAESFETGWLALGNRQTYTVPGNATNIRIKGENATGLVWAPRKTIFDGPGTLNTCYKSYGTTLSPSWNTNCN